MSARLRLSAALSAERRRTKERLEASLGGLCELELLKHRQEARVRGALLLGDGPAPSAASPDGGAVTQPRSSVRCAPWAVVAGLDQQVSDLKVKPASWCGGGGAAAACLAPLSSDDFAGDEDACPEPSHSTAAPGSPSSPRETADADTAEARTSEPSEQSPARDTGNPPRENPLSLKLETYIFGLLQRGCVPTRPSKTRTGPPHEARGVGLSPVRHSAVCHKENNDSSDRASVQQALCSEARPKPPQRERQAQDAPRLQQQPQHHTGPYPKAGPADASLPNPPPGEMTTPFPDSSDSDPDAPQHFQKYQPPFAAVKSAAPPSADEQLVSAEYIPAQPCGASSRAYAHYLSASHRGSAAAKAGRGAYSPDRTQLYQEQPHSTLHTQASRPRGGTKKARSHEDKNGCGRKQGKKNCRPQSENGPQRGPERRYNTAEREGGAGAAARGSRAAQPRSRKQQEGSGGSQRCHSTAELGPDRAEPPPPPHLSSACGQREHVARRPRRPQPAHTPPYAYPQHSLHQHFHHQQHPQHQGPPCPPAEDRRRPGPGESESSTSEADSPESSSSSSDSDESAGLVWPQQLSPQLALPSRAAAPGAHLQPKAFVKIKASHALKKKILRFRTGSLKVMTTV